MSDPFLNLRFRHFDDLKEAFAYILNCTIGIGVHLDKDIFIRNARNTHSQRALALGRMAKRIEFMGWL